MANLHAGPRDAEWAKVEEARAKQQPRTVIELLAYASTLLLVNRGRGRDDGRRPRRSPRASFVAGL